MPMNALCACAAILILLTSRVLAEPLPPGFTYLSTIEPAISQDIRYFGANNFIGRRVTGYEAPECVLTEAAAIALARAHTSLAGQGFGLKVYDCYRPASAVADFVAWSKTSGQNEGKAYFYPTLAKNRLFYLGYIASRSNHSAGSTVDVGLIRKAGAKEQGQPSGGSNSNLPSVKVDGSSNCLNSTARDEVDMGSDFDCFHPKSKISAEGLEEAESANRKLLRRAMSEAGFEAYEMEWWHFRLKNEPFPKRVFNFPISAKPPLTRGR